MPGIDLHQTLRDCLLAIDPITRDRKITIKLKESPEACLTTLPMDEVLGPVFFLLLRLIYILPENRELTIKILKRFDPPTQGWFLRVEISLFNMHINPNLIFKPDNNRFKLEQLTDKNTRIFIEWQIHDVADKVSPVASASFDALEVADATNASMLSNSYYDFFIFSRYKEYGKNAFVKEKLNGTKSRKEADFQQELLGAILNQIHDEKFDSDALGKKLGLSRTQLYRKIKELTGSSTANFIRHVRLKKATELLESSELSVSEVSAAVGFNEPSYFSSSFLEFFHMSPSEWRKTKKTKA
jgi:AraC-like DNA-binding protein